MSILFSAPDRVRAGVEPTDVRNHVELVCLTTLADELEEAIICADTKTRFAVAVVTTALSGLAGARRSPVLASQIQPEPTAERDRVSDMQSVSAKRGACDPCAMSVRAISGGAKLRLHELFLAYIEVMRRASTPDWDDLLASEIYHRLERLEWLEWELRERDLEARDPRSGNERTAELMVEIPALAESWYYMAFRTMRLIAKRCPDLGAFEVKSVTLTRNKLIEHDDEIFNAGITLGPNGPVVKGARWDGQPDGWQDPDVAEFDSQLRGLLDAFPLRNAKEKRAS